MKNPLSWTPVRRGSRYCAPACGRGCTWQEYQAAKKLGRETARQLGKGWKPVVWENLGWHVRVDSPTGHVKVFVHCGFEGKGTGYTAFLCQDPTSSAGKLTAHGRTAKSAVRILLVGARMSIGREIASLQALLAAMGALGQRWN